MDPRPVTYDVLAPIVPDDAPDVPWEKLKDMCEEISERERRELH